MWCVVFHSRSLCVVIWGRGDSQDTKAILEAWSEGLFSEAEHYFYTLIAYVLWEFTENNVKSKDTCCFGSGLNWHNSLARIYQCQRCPVGLRSFQYLSFTMWYAAFSSCFFRKPDRLFSIKMIDFFNSHADRHLFLTFPSGRCFRGHLEARLRRIQFSYEFFTPKIQSSFTHCECGE